MRVSPISIKKQEFNKKLRGYDPEEVQAFLDKLADEFESVQKENESLKKQFEEAREQLIEYRKIEKSLQDTLLKAHESSSKAVESTRKQTSLMIKEAEIKASQILEKARENANDMRNAVIRLREERNLIIARLKAIVHSQAQLLDIKIEQPEEENTSTVKAEQSNQIDIDVSGIVDKLL